MKMNDKKTKIIESTLLLITEYGFHGTSMAQISKEANVAAGTIYHHFKNKEDLILQAYDFVNSKLGIAIVKNDNTDTAYKERFTNFWINIYDFFILHPSFFKFLVQYANSPFITNEKKQESLILYYEPIIQFLGQGIQNNKFINTDIYLAVSFLYGGICETAHLHLNGELEITADRLKQAIQMSWNSLSNN